MALDSKTFSPSRRVLAMVSSCCLVYGWNTTRLHCTPACVNKSMFWQGKAPLVQPGHDTKAVPGYAKSETQPNGCACLAHRLQNILPLLKSAHGNAVTLFMPQRCCLASIQPIVILQCCSKVQGLSAAQEPTKVLTLNSFACCISAPGMHTAIKGQPFGGREEWKRANREPSREAILGRSLSGRSMVLATPMTASRLPFLIGHSNRLYSTCACNRGE